MPPAQHLKLVTTYQIFSQISIYNLSTIHSRISEQQIGRKCWACEALIKPHHITSVYIMC